MAPKAGTAAVACAGLAGLGFVASPDSGNRRVPVAVKASAKASPEAGAGGAGAFTVGTAAATAGAMAISTRRKGRASRVASRAEVAPGEKASIVRS